MEELFLQGLVALAHLVNEHIEQQGEGVFEGGILNLLDHIEEQLPYGAFIGADPPLVGEQHVLDEYERNVGANLVIVECLVALL